MTTISDNAKFWLAQRLRRLHAGHIVDLVAWTVTAGVVVAVAMTMWITLEHEARTESPCHRLTRELQAASDLLAVEKVKTLLKLEGCTW